MEAKDNEPPLDLEVTESAKARSEDSPDGCWVGDGGKMLRSVRRCEG